MPQNADLSSRVVIETASLPWEPTTAEGVERRMLEQHESATRATTAVVRYAAGAEFPMHEHPFGEEILVIEGDLGDEHGDYPAGTYLRQPAGSAHRPFSRQGCLLFVRRGQLPLSDTARVVADWNTRPWTPGRAPRVHNLEFAHFGRESTGMVRFEPGAQSTQHTHNGGEELYVISGGYRDQYGSYSAGTWVRSPDGSNHLPVSPQGCLLFIKTGHLPRTVTRVGEDGRVAKAR